MFHPSKYKIAVLGLGYVGLPLALAFSKKFLVKGYDNDCNRIEELKEGKDRTKEADLKELTCALQCSKHEFDAGLQITSIIDEIRDCNVFIVTVPTSIDKFKNPNLSYLINACDLIGQVLKKDDIVIFESTVYPGCTEDECVPVLEKGSGLKFNKDFYCGYSPERINPGDKQRTLTSIKKITSGSTPIITDIIDKLYQTIITAGTHKVSSIKIAEAAKAIENAQRDINISFVNELALIFDRIGIDTTEVLDAAATKWNFVKYKPGLVGGHCIGVDPYYLARKAESLGYYPQVILSGRKVNDSMGVFVANKTVKLMIQKGHAVKGANALILGITFKENCPDIRNSRVPDIYHELIQFGMNVSVYDLHADKKEVKKEYGIDMIDKIESNYDAIILSVAHDEFLKIDYQKLKNSNTSVLFDTKSVLERTIVDGRL